MEPTVGPERYRKGEWVVNETDVYTHRYKTRGPEHSIGFSIAHVPSNTRLIWGMKRLPDAKAVVRWVNEVCPSPKIEREDGDVVSMDEASERALRAVVLRVDHARHHRLTIRAERARSLQDVLADQDE